MNEARPSAPSSTPQAMAQAAHLEAQGRFADAETEYRRIIDAQPGFAPAWHALGLLAVGTDRLEQAAEWMARAAMLDPAAALYQRNVGEVCRRLGRLPQAIACGVAATKLAPKDLDAHYNLGLAYTDAKDYAKAIQAYRKALKLNPNHGLSWNNLGSALEQQGDKEGALKAYEKAVALNPQHAEAQNNAGAIYSELGRLDEARAAFAAAIAARPDFVEAHYNLSAFKSYAKDDPHLANLEAVYAQRHALSDHARIRYCFALGKALDDIGDYDRAFATYDEGNRLQHALLPMEEAGADAMLARIMATFDEAFFAARREWRGFEHGRTPIFIVGMPRSGTTLLEQILCSHASVFGAGELVELNDAIVSVCGMDFAAAAQALDETKLRAIGRNYVERVWKQSPKSGYITDKMPANFLHLGLIHLALPGAKIIHAMRDPMDSCFSCFSRLFNDTMEFAYDQGTLGRYYVRYMKLMAHWRRVLPEGTILDLPYEKMVDDTEGQARRVLEFVGLPWDANCLEFHKNTRLVKTASVAQVRKPIYKTSVSRWKHFARHLRPLWEIVRDYRPVDDFPAEAAAAEPARTAESWHVEGIALYKQDRFDDALACYDRALALRPDFPEALNSKGFLLQDIGRLEEARGCFAQALKLAPEMAMARLNLAMAQLKLGNWEAGWENYETRWTGSAESGLGLLQRPIYPLPQWNGEGGTETLRLLVVTEQGFGDAFQFARYLPFVARRFAGVGFVCPPPTLRLMEWAVGDEVALFTRMPADFGDWDLQCPLMSLPRAFGTRVDSIPTATPYLKVTPAAAAYWRARLDRAAPGRCRIGIAWAGRKGHQYDARRSLRFEQIAPLLEDKRITWVSLQKWAPEDVRPAIPADVDWIDWTDELTDFADSAALVANLDRIITIDSAMVHLAGALNVPVWMLDRYDNEWRWLVGRADSPWYPSLRIFRQDTFGDWDGVLQEAAQALAVLPAPSVPRATRAAPSAVAPASELQPPAPGTVTPDRALELASRAQAAGRLVEAERLLHQILTVAPNHAHALHLLGVVAHQAGQPQLAIDLVTRAVAQCNDVALFHSNLAEMCRQQGRLDEAIRHGRSAVELDPSMASAHGNLGIALYDAQDYDGAETCHRQALALVPGFAQSLNNLGSIQRKRKNLKDAASCYRKALETQPDYLESLSNLGAVLVEDERADDAVPFLERALQLQPDYPEALCNLGLARFKQDRAEDAAALLQRSLALKPGYPEALVGLARALHDLERLDEAAALLREAVGHAPDMAEAHCQLGTVCTEQDKADEAEAAYRRALALDPAHADALTGLGNLKLEAGAIDEAERLLREAIAAAPDNVGARFHLVQAKKVKSSDDNLAALEALAGNDKDMTADKRISLHYALGKAYDDIGEWERAFPHFLEGARIKRGKLHYDTQADEARAWRIADVIDVDFLARLQGGGDASEAPVFVLGMPRSGTTLTEQIIASHPEVFGAGELSDFMEIVQQAPVPGGAVLSYPENLPLLSCETLTAWGGEYATRLTRRAPMARRITDKMPANYLGLGLIPLMLPNARIVHVVRNPVDTCLSCFTRLFNRHQDATYDLAELGRHYVAYARLMQHWRAVLPGRFLEVQYEDIVANMEGQARRLIDFCDLEWNDACLAFHKTKRSIRTASVTQVRQPIYNSSVERWRHYEKFLGPLLEALGEFAPRP